MNQCANCGASWDESQDKCSNCGSDTLRFRIVRPMDWLQRVNGFLQHFARMKRGDFTGKPT